MHTTCLLKFPNKCRVRIFTTLPTSNLPVTTFVSVTNLPESNSISKFMPNHPILPIIEKAKARHSIDFRTLHAHTITSGLFRDTFAASRVVEFSLQTNLADLRYADSVFDAIDWPDVYTWNAMISGHTAHGSSDSAVRYYFRMRAGGAPPNNYTFALLVKACVANCSIDSGREVHGQVLKCGIEDLLVVKNTLLRMYSNMGLLEDAELLFEKSLHLDLISWNTMISAYGKSGDIGRARDLFDRLPKVTLVSWSAMLDGYVKNGEFSEALRLFGEMQAEKLKPDAVTLVSVLTACAKSGALDQGRWIHLYIDRNGLRKDGNVVLETALVDMYSKCGCIDAALQVFDSVRNGDIVLWNAMIGGLAMNGYGGHAIDLFRKMKDLGLAPNGTTFIGVLCACVHGGMVDDGFDIFKSMKVNGVEPQREHYGCLADLLGRAGRLKEAEDVLLNMPMEPQASQWGALMAACRTHKDVEVGERVGMRLISLEPHDGGRYVLLSNMYAAAGKWDDARETRRLMESKGIKKETGCSFIEWNGVVHQFVVGDMKHPQCKQIYAVLGEMERKLELAGYVGDGSQSLIDMDDEEEKRMTLLYHSEKLAIAFGIVNMDVQRSIRIVKNIRVCIDCHRYMKFVSKVYDREIVLRDRNRFHRFIEGECSCRDYW